MYLSYFHVHSECNIINYANLNSNNCSSVFLSVFSTLHWHRKNMTCYSQNIITKLPEGFEMNPTKYPVHSACTNFQLITYLQHVSRPEVHVNKHAGNMHIRHTIQINEINWLLAVLSAINEIENATLFILLFVLRGYHSPSLMKVHKTSL